MRGRRPQVAEDALDYEWGYEWPTADQWAAGQNYGRCWAPETSIDEPVTDDQDEGRPLRDRVRVRGPGGALLTVRKRGTSRFMLPGGKLEPGETPVACAVREAAEEIGLTFVERRSSSSSATGRRPRPTSRGPSCGRPCSSPPSGRRTRTPRARSRSCAGSRSAGVAPDLAPLLVEHVLPALEARD